MKQLFSKFLVAFILTSAVVLSWSEHIWHSTYKSLFELEFNIQSFNIQGSYIANAKNMLTRPQYLGIQVRLG